MSNLQIYHVSKNLFDKNNTTVYNAYIGNNSYWLLNADSLSIKILCNPNSIYTLSINVPNNAVFRIYETDNENAEPASSETVLLTETIRGTTNQSYSFTTLATTKAIVFQGSAAYVADWINTLMLNTGSGPLPYEPYSSEVWHDLAPQQRINGVFVDNANIPEKYSGGSWS